MTDGAPIPADTPALRASVSQQLVVGVGAFVVCSAITYFAFMAGMTNPTHRGVMGLGAGVFMAIGTVIGMRRPAARKLTTAGLSMAISIFAAPALLFTVLAIENLEGGVGEAAETLLGGAFASLLCSWIFTLPAGMVFALINVGLVFAAEKLLRSPDG